MNGTDHKGGGGVTQGPLASLTLLILTIREAGCTTKTFCQKLPLFGVSCLRFRTIIFLLFLWRPSDS